MKSIDLGEIVNIEMFNPCDSRITEIVCCGPISVRRLVRAAVSGRRVTAVGTTRAVRGWDSKHRNRLQRLRVTIGGEIQAYEPRTAIDNTQSVRLSFINAEVEVEPIPV